MECPSTSETIFGFTLRVSSSVAHVCRRSWERISGSLDRFRSGLNERRVRLWRLRGSSVSEANMRPFSLHSDPIYFSLVALQVVIEGLLCLAVELHATTGAGRLWGREDRTALGKVSVRRTWR